jgi:hypothetical protein
MRTSWRSSVAQQVIEDGRRHDRGPRVYMLDRQGHIVSHIDCRTWYLWHFRADTGDTASRPLTPQGSHRSASPSAHCKPAACDTQGATSARTPTGVHSPLQNVWRPWQASAPGCYASGEVTTGRSGGVSFLPLTTVKPSCSPHGGICPTLISGPQEGHNRAFHAGAEATGGVSGLEEERDMGVIKQSAKSLR